jgi:putative hydrolase of the HAD superfamily
MLRRENAVTADYYAHQAELAAEMLKQPSEEVREKIDRLIYRGWAPHFKHIALFPHAREAITAIREAGLKTALLSDFPPEEKLAFLGIDSNWDAVLCSERSGALKPAARSFKDLSAALSLPPEHILYVGNSYRYDVLGAREAGMRTALITSAIKSRFHRFDPAPDFCFHDYRQLSNFVLRGL